MSAVNYQPDTRTQSAYQGEPVVNDFALMVATKNGSGSQTSNEVLIRSLFRMGIPVSGKNLFPSNIKGLPTWYTIRASKDSYIARRATTEVAVAMNQDTAAEDIDNLPEGGVCIIPEEWKWGQSRQDIVYYEIPVKATLGLSDIPSDFRDRIANMVYVGACAYLFNMPLDIVRKALLDTFNGKEKPANMNFEVIQNAYDWSKENLVKQDPFRFEPLDLTEGKILITGNEAGALGAIFGGLTVASWYPITPSTSVIDAVLDHKHLRKDPETGKDTVAVVQAEDELAAIGMIIGAGWAGARAMTATSGPGISLMAEFTGLAYFAEIPCVIWDITRMGPSTGLPTRTSQGDLLFIHFLGHGDTRQVALLPGNVAECFEFGWLAFDMADHFQTPVFVMSDLDLGMNIWMSEPFAYPGTPINRGKLLADKEKFEAFLAEHGEWYRFRDYDNDAVPYRTIPGIDHLRAAYFTRGTGHNDMATYSERGEDWVQNLTRISNKIDSSRAILPQPVIDYDPQNEIGIISFGSNDPAVQEGRDRLAAAGIGTNSLRVRALPLAASVKDFIFKHKRVYVVENNHDGQLAQLIRLETAEDTTHMISLPLGDTLPMTAKWVFESVTQWENK
ncbi:MAG: 2-oxoacid:acceptor oxidoreductase subunit alpha [Anaerolineae bacterium]|nr:2-oxoacid:acceptor oxidoreductase subunit alpha [Anaerolineae bacterium]